MPAEFFGLLPAVGAGALANELAIQRSPDPFGAAAAVPGFVVGILTVWMVAGIDGKHKHPDFSEILLESLNWGNFSRRLYSDCTVWPRFFRPNL